MTPELSHEAVNFTVMATQTGGEESTVTETTCPWCEADIALAAAEEEAQQCPECLTTWSFVAERDQRELALAA